jgi:hypothetical protein
MCRASVYVTFGFLTLKGLEVVFLGFRVHFFRVLVFKVDIGIKHKKYYIFTRTA